MSTAISAAVGGAAPPSPAGAPTLPARHLAAPSAHRPGYHRPGVAARAAGRTSARRAVQRKKQEPAIAAPDNRKDDATSAQPDRPKVAAVIAAHPDDPDFGAGGTAALWTQDGWEFHYIIVTNGAKGSSDREMTRERLIALRQEEQRACARVYGVSSCTFLGAEDGELEYSRDMLGKIVREIRRLKPHAVFTHSDGMIHRRAFGASAGEDERFIGFVNHRDHRNTGIMAVDAVYPTARDHLNFPEQIEQEGLATHNVAEIYIWGHDDANFAVDITDTVETKLRGLIEHKSQFADRGEAFPQGMRDRFRDEDGRFYERFLRVTLPF